jgi:hypothetical protein
MSVVNQFFELLICKLLLFLPASNFIAMAFYKENINQIPTVVQNSPKLHFLNRPLRQRAYVLYALTYYTFHFSTPTINELSSPPNSRGRFLLTFPKKIK